MSTEDLRALTEQGPRVVMVSSADMLKLLDERDEARQALAILEADFEDAVRDQGARLPRHVRATLLAPWLAPVLAGVLFGLWVAAHLVRWVAL